MHNVTIKTMRGMLYSLVVSLMLATASAAHSAPRLAGLLDGALPQVNVPKTDISQASSFNAAPKISPAQAAQRAREKYGGKVLSVDLESNGTNPYYRVKIIEKGNVRAVRVPAN